MVADLRAFFFLIIEKIVAKCQKCLLAACMELVAGQGFGDI